VNTFKKIFFLIIIILIISGSTQSQVTEYLGLKGKHISSLKIGEGKIAVGTNFNGVYWQSLYQINDSSWNKIDIDSVNVTSVYPHKSGPIGWAIGIGTEPNIYDTNFVYCSYQGSKPKSLSYGFDIEVTKSISRIDGFPDPTICGETFAIGGRKLYCRYFIDTVWHSVYDLTIEGNFESLKARENFATVYAGGVEGFAGMLLIRTNDKGKTWENLSPLCAVADVDFWNGNDTTIFVTDRNKVMRSSDNGSTWSNVFRKDSIQIQKISFSSDGKSFYMVANSGSYSLPRSYLIYSDNNGSSWTTIQLPINDIIVGMDIDSENSIYLASISLGIYKISSPIVQIEEHRDKVIIKDFKLFDNYPNPFNSSTIISYQIPVTCEVSLKIFNLLGNEVATLVNLEQSAGKYSVEFSSNTKSKIELTSGVYLCRLQAGNYSTTKKMILLK
jgi:hypothetical protein